MIEEIRDLYDKGEKSLESFLRGQAFQDVQADFEKQGVDINSVSDEDLETLVAEKVQNKINELKGGAKASVISLALFFTLGI